VCRGAPTVVLALGRFDGSLTAADAAAALAAGFRRGVPAVRVVAQPLAGAGDGLVPLVLGLRWERRSATVRGPRGEAVQVTWALRDRVAVMEVPRASGVGGVPGRTMLQSAASSSSVDTGQLIGAALDAGARRIILSTGDSDVDVDVTSPGPEDEAPRLARWPDLGLGTTLGARLAPRIELVLELTGFADAVAGADLVVVGEESLEDQSLLTKGPAAAAAVADRAGIPVVAVVGRNGVSATRAREAGIAEIWTLSDPQPDRTRSTRRAASLLERVGEAVSRDWLIAPLGSRRTNTVTCLDFRAGAGGRWGGVRVEQGGSVPGRGRRGCDRGRSAR
jgi:glycerate kinase